MPPNHNFNRGSSDAGTEQIAPKSDKGIQKPRSTHGLAAVGLENFKIGALHEAIQGELVEGSDDFYPGDHDMPESFRGNPSVV